MAAGAPSSLPKPPRKLGHLPRSLHTQLTRLPKPLEEQIELLKPSASPTPFNGQPAAPASRNGPTSSSLRRWVDLGAHPGPTTTAAPWVRRASLAETSSACGGLHSRRFTEKLVRGGRSRWVLWFGHLNRPKRWPNGCERTQKPIGAPITVSREFRD